MKLTAQDLQIGNYFYRPDCTDKVVEIRKNGVIGLDLLRGLIPFSEIKGIPITPEILENNGFKKLNEGRFLLEDLEDNYWVKFYPKDTNYTHGGYDYIDLSSGCMYIREVPIKYVHQLQQIMRLCGIKGKEIEL